MDIYICSTWVEYPNTSSVNYDRIKMVFTNLIDGNRKEYYYGDDDESFILFHMIFNNISYDSDSYIFDYEKLIPHKNKYKIIKDMLSINPMMLYQQVLVLDPKKGNVLTYRLGKSTDTARYIVHRNDTLYEEFVWLLYKDQMTTPVMESITLASIKELENTIDEQLRRNCNDQQIVNALNSYRNTSL